jgi:hypothetical protein
MKQLRVRFADKDDAPTVIRWLNDNPQNRYDSAILRYPTLSTLCAYEPDGGPVAYLPTHRVLMLESVALRPNLERLTSAQALRDLTKAAGLIAHAQGMREVYMLEGAGGLAELAERNGFEGTWKAYRLKL